MSNEKSYIQNLSQIHVSNSGPYFYGDLISGGILENVAKQRSKLIKEEDFGKALEDEVWLLFKRFGFIEMNRDRNFKIQAGSRQKQIDIYARDDHNVFVIFCTSQENTGPSNSLKEKIHEISDLKIDISTSIKKYYNKKFRVSFLLVTRNITWNETEENLASNKDIFFWKEEDIEAYKMLVEQLGYAAKYQLYGLLFPQKKASEVGEITVPAMRGGKGKNKYYCFLIQPEKLFKIAYVHRREKSKPKEVGSAYQRMINKKRIEEIGQFIDDGNEFPNNIILNFSQKPQFKPMPKVKEILGISYGILKFPPYYGCAWIIDGQHRLYGYSKSEHAADHTIPVIAFESRCVKDQANLFVDINQEQKSVNKNLLWDLYPDIYEGSEDEGQQILRTISLVAKKLNSDEGSAFHNYIQIPSMLIKSKEEVNLTLTNICDGIKENRLINREEGLLFKEDYEKSVNFAAEIIESYFESIVSPLISDWEKGERGLLRTNVGVRIFFIILRQLLRHFNYEGKENIYRKKDLTEFKNETKKILAPIIEKLSKMNERDINEIRSESAKGLVMKNAQKLVWDLKENFGFGLELWNNKNAWNPGIPEGETDDKIVELIDDTEIKLRGMIIEILKKKYKEEWWKQGIPGSVKEGIEKNMEQDISRFPWKKKEMDSLPNEEKLKFSLTSNLKDIIINGNNWESFEKIFYKYKECVSVQFSFLENFRNKYKHPERKLSLDEVEKGLGYYGMGWIRKCIGLNPKKVI
jgi:DGQHR domain-containing protein